MVADGKIRGVMPVDLAIGPFWPALRTLFEEAMPYGRGEFTLEDLREAIAHGEVFVIAMVDQDAEVVFAAACSVVCYPQKRVLYIQYGAGKAGAQMKSVLCTAAKTLKCDWIETRCRASVARLYRRHGFDIDYCVPILEMNE